MESESILSLLDELLTEISPYLGPEDLVDKMGSESILNLPNELLTEIFSYLSPEDLVDKVRKTCTGWRDITYTSVLWRMVTFRPSYQMSDSDLLSYIEEMPQLRSFVLNHERDTSMIINTVREHCDDIKSVIIRNKVGTNKNSITDMLLTFPNMECFDVVASESRLSLDYAQLYGMFHSRSSVNMLTKEGSHTNEFILSPSIGYIPDIEVLSPVPNSKVHSVINKKRNDIKTFSANCDVDADTFKLICTCKELRYLFICDTQYCGPPINVAYLANLTNLQTLQLVGFRDIYSYISPLVFEDVVFSHLHKLEIIQGGSLLEALLTPLLPACPKLKHLNVQENILTDELLDNIRFCKYLEYLDISRNCCLTDAFISNIARSCTNLKFLDISSCVGISENFIHLLNTCRKLETLRIEGKYYSGLLFRLIPVMLPNLKEFYVTHFYNSYILDDLVSKMPTLRILKCNKNPDECYYIDSD